MAFFNTQKMKTLVERGDIIEEGKVDPDRIKQGAYHLALGQEVYVTSDQKKTQLPVTDRSQISIEPGQFAMLLTEESIRIPDYAIGFISIRSKYKFRGLLNVSGFHVDPGYTGRLKFSVYNAGAQNITLTRGDAMFPMWLSLMVPHPTEDPYEQSEEDKRNCKRITSQDVQAIEGVTVSPKELNDRLESVETKINIIAVFVVIAALTFAAVMTPIAWDLWKEMILGN